MTPDKAQRELDEDCAIERVKRAIEGDDTATKLDDAMRRATPLAETGEISPLAMVLIGTIYRGAHEGDTLAELKAFYVRQHDGSAAMADKWDRAIEQLRQHNLLPDNLHLKD